MPGAEPGSSDRTDDAGDGSGESSQYLNPSKCWRRTYTHSNIIVRPEDRITLLAPTSQDWRELQLQQALVDRGGIQFSRIAQRFEIVLDPFGGGGSTFEAAQRANRLWIGSEIVDCELIRERFSRNLPGVERASLPAALSAIFTSSDVCLKSSKKSTTMVHANA